MRDTVCVADFIERRQLLNYAPYTAMPTTSEAIPTINRRGVSSLCGAARGQWPLVGLYTVPAAAEYNALEVTAAQTPRLRGNYDQLFITLFLFDWFYCIFRDTNIIAFVVRTMPHPPCCSTPRRRTLSAIMSLAHPFGTQGILRSCTRARARTGRAIRGVRGAWDARVAWGARETHAWREAAVCAEFIWTKYQAIMCVCECERSKYKGWSVRLLTILYL